MDENLNEKYIIWKKNLIQKILNNEVDSINYSVEKNLDVLQNLYPDLSVDEIKNIELEIEQLDNEIYAGIDGTIYNLEDAIYFLYFLAESYEEMGREEYIKILGNESDYNENLMFKKIYDDLIEDLKKEYIDIFGFSWYIREIIEFDHDKKLILKRSKVK